jgi:hypothetical protein
VFRIRLPAVSRPDGHWAGHGGRRWALVVLGLLGVEGEGRRGRGVLEGIARGGEREVPGEAKLVVDAGGDGAITRLEALSRAADDSAWSVPL